MKLMVRYIMACTLLLVFSVTAHAQDMVSQSQFQPQFTELDIRLLASDITVADGRMPAYTRQSSVPNIPDSAFEKPMITENNIHMYLGLASLAMGGLAGITAPDGFDPDLLNSVHFKAAKLSWQLGAAAVASGLYSHWDDFHIEDGLLDRDNMHALLGLLGTIGYYSAVKGAVDQYNSVGYPSSDHASAGIFGGAAMTIAIGLTW